jgi:hypothetical protein
MNDYQQRNEDRYSADAERVVILTAELNKLDSEEWTVHPRDNDSDHCPTRHTIGCSSGLMILCNHNGYGLECRWRFSACGWPSYVDSDNRRQSVDTSNLYNPKESQPTTTAADTRTYEAIAKQILGKLITPYRAIYVRCAELCGENDAYHVKQEAALKAVTEAAGEVYEFGKQRNRQIRCRLEEQVLYCEFNSADAVRLEMNARQAALVLKMLRVDAEDDGQLELLDIPAFLRRTV